MLAVALPFTFTPVRPTGWLARAFAIAAAVWGRTVPDAELIHAVARGDRAALGQLYDRHVALLFGIARRILRNEREAEDLVHDVFLEVWRRAGDFDPGRGSARSWLVLRVRSRALDRLRSAAFARTSSLETTTLPFEASVEPAVSTGTIEAGVVRQAVDQLPRDQRTVIELGYFEGLTMTQIAKQLEMPLGTVKSRLSRALVKLREARAAMDAEPS